MLVLCGWDFTRGTNDIGFSKLGCESIRINPLRLFLIYLSFHYHLRLMDFSVFDVLLVDVQHGLRTSDENIPLCEKFDKFRLHLSNSIKGCNGCRADKTRPWKLHFVRDVCVCVLCCIEWAIRLLMKKMNISANPFLK